jgi:hypothetical protein
MPSILSKPSCASSSKSIIGGKSQKEIVTCRPCSQGSNCHANLEQLGVPLKCTTCMMSCDVCAITCKCERCVLRRQFQPCCIDAARIAVVQTQRKLAYHERKKKKRIVYEAVKNCIVKITKKGSYKKAFKIGEGADQLPCCKKAFDLTYRINHSYVDELVQYMKKKVCPSFVYTVLFVA